MLLKNKKTGLVARYTPHMIGYTKDGSSDIRPCVRVKYEGKDQMLTYASLKDLCADWEDAGIDEEPADDDEEID